MENNKNKDETHIAIFDGKKIRRKWFNNEWWFAAMDIVSALTDSKDPNGYLKDMRRRDEGFNEGWGQIATPLEIDTSGGKQKVNCVSTKGAFRLIQSIPSKKAEWNKSHPPLQNHSPCEPYYTGNYTCEEWQKIYQPPQRKNPLSQ